MVVLNVILYKSSENKLFVANHYGTNVIGINSTKEEAIKGLEESIKLVIDEARKNPKVVLVPKRYEGCDLLISGLTKIILESEKYHPQVRELPKYGIILNIYDLTNVDLVSQREKLEPRIKREWTELNQ